MSSFTKEEYLALLEKLAAEQYDEAVENDPVVEMEWMPGESEIAKKIHLVNRDGTIDLTNAKKDKVKQTLIEYKYANLKVGDFLIRITNYRGEPNKKGADVSLDVSLYCKVYRTPSGAPCDMLNKFNIQTDTRFENRPWLKHFGPATMGTHGSKIPIDTMADIIRWMQVVKKLSAFV